MGFNFRKSIKIAPGVRLNLTKKGLSSLSVGKNGSRVNIGKKGIKTTAGIPGSGLSYTTQTTFKKDKRNLNTPNNLLTSEQHVKESRNFFITILLWVGILLMPYFFVWFTLQRKYTRSEKIVAFSWLLLFVLILMSK